MGKMWIEITGDFFQIFAVAFPALKVAVPVPKLSSRNCAFVHVAESAIFRRPAWFAEKLGSKNAEG
jgi:hypothetical protein